MRVTHIVESAGPSPPPAKAGQAEGAEAQQGQGGRFGDGGALGSRNPDLTEIGEALENRVREAGQGNQLPVDGLDRQEVIAVAQGVIGATRAAPPR